MKNILKTFGYGIIGVIFMAFMVLMSVGGMWSIIFLFIHMSDVTGWACVLRFIIGIFALAISIIVTLLIGLIGCAIREEEKKMINKYRKKSVIVEAVIWTGNNIDEVKELAKNATENLIFDNNDLFIETLEGNMKVSVGDYIIKGVEGEFYPCKPNIFKKTYETVSMVSDNDRTTVPMSQYRKLENKNKKLRNTVNRLKRVIEKQEDELL